MSSWYVLIVMVVLLVGCGSGDGEGETESRELAGITLVGHIEKGPYILGATVEIFPLDDNGVSEGASIPTVTEDKLGRFSISTTLTGPVRVAANGFFYSEVRGVTSSEKLRLNAIYNINESIEQLVNVNLATHLISGRVTGLMLEGLPVDDAIGLAEKEFIDAIEPLLPMRPASPFSTIRIYDVIASQTEDSRYLLALSSIVSQYAKIQSDLNATSYDAELRAIIGSMEVDFTNDGVLNESDPARTFKDASRKVATDEIIEHLEARSIEALGYALAVPSIDSLIDTDDDGDMNNVDPDIDGDGINNENDESPYRADILLEGNVQLGPFQENATIKVRAIDKQGNDQLASIDLHTQGDMGGYNFYMQSMTPIHLQAKGYYYNPVTHSKSNSAVELHAIHNITSSLSQTANINLLTHLTYRRITKLMRNGFAVGDAMSRAEAELLNGFATLFPVDISTLEHFDRMEIYSISVESIKGNAFLLSLFSTLYQYAVDQLSTDSPASLIERRFMDEVEFLSRDLEDDGVLEDVSLQLEYQKASRTLDHRAVENRLNTYSERRDHTIYLSVELDGVLDKDGDNITNADDLDDDNDGVEDLFDILPYDKSESLDTDGDGIGNNADLDDDGDGVLDDVDHFPLDSSEFVDTDGDGQGNAADIDDDNDGINDVDEIRTNPLDPDSDDDGLLDGEEDLNKNGRVDLGETNPMDRDSDDDGLSDGEEVITNPLDPDSDNDGFCDGQRFDNDGDGINPEDSCLSGPPLSEMIFTDEVLAACVAEEAARSRWTMASEFTSLTCSNPGVADAMKITSLEGIEQLVALEYLSVNYNFLTVIDLSSNLQLRILYVNSNDLLSVNLSQNAELKYINLGNNRLGGLETLDLSGNEKLEFLDLTNNKISEVLGLTGKSELWALSLKGNELTEIDVSTLPNLRLLNLEGNQLTELNVRSNEQLSSLVLAQNPMLGDVDISNNLLLSWLDLGGTNVSEIDLTEHTDLLALMLNGNELSEIDISKNTQLQTLDLSQNQMTEIDLTNNAALTWLHLESNAFVEVDLSAQTELTILDLSHNNLVALNVTASDILRTCFLQWNDLGPIDFSMNRALNYLEIHNNNITELNLTDNRTLVTLSAANNRLVDVDLSENRFLNFVDLKGNPLSAETISFLETADWIPALFYSMPE